MILRFFCLLTLINLTCFAWLDYSDNLPAQKVAFGDEFQNISLKLHPEKFTFEQDENITFHVTIRNSSERTFLLPKAMNKTDRQYFLYFFLVNKNGNSYASDNMIFKTSLPEKSMSGTINFNINDIKFTAFKQFENGLPSYVRNAKKFSLSTLTPQIYSFKVVILSALKEKRPDFVVTSNIIHTMLLPKSAAKMASAEKQEKLDKWLKTLKTGAYGGAEVSSQLAALGEDAVEPLIEIAEAVGGNKTRESRIWAIVTLCNTHSVKAEEYIIKRLNEPLSEGDLSFLAWHCQGFNSQEINKVLMELLDKCADNTSWKLKSGEEISPGGKYAFIEFTAKHFISKKIYITDDILAKILKLDSEKAIAFSLMAWKPEDFNTALNSMQALLKIPQLHNNLRKAVLNKLSQTNPPAKYPKLAKTETDIDKVWLLSCYYIGKEKLLPQSEVNEMVQALILSSRKVTHLQLAQRVYYTLNSGVTKEMWAGALKNKSFTDEDKVKFLLGLMRLTALSEQMKGDILISLKPLMGSDYPLTDNYRQDIDAVWETCGNWLIKQGYFKKQ